ncbi:MAG: AsmA-like C-terminal region-containing protein [Candidatus Kuenenia sp.]|nr:AsmA-like C-terminal region-containing protein [Candidatus Kuenenia hertensis]
MQIQENKILWIKWLIISLCLIFLIAAIFLFVYPYLISEKSITQKTVLFLENKLPSSAQIGTVSYRWPNQIQISRITVQKEDKDAETTTQFNDIQGTLNLFPLLLKKIIFKKIEIKQINYENSLLIEDLFTDTLSVKDNVIITHAHCRTNGGNTHIHGVIKLSKNKPEYNVTVEAKDVYITQEMPVLRDLPLFKTEGSEAGGILSIEGNISGKEFGKKTLNKHLKGRFTLRIRNGYMKSMSLFSSLSEIIAINELYSFDLLETEVQIKEETIYTPRAIIDSQLLKLDASGMIGFGGKLFYNANVTVNEKLLNADIEKLAGTAFTQNAMPLEITGTVNDPKISIKLSQDNIEQLVKELTNDFLHTNKEGKAGNDHK